LFGNPYAALSGPVEYKGFTAEEVANTVDKKVSEERGKWKTESLEKTFAQTTEKLMSIER